MKKYAYYNEHDPNAAEWLRELIKLNQIAPGEVDSRSIVDVDSDELKSFSQHHFFAGIGVWSYALRQAGWSDEREIITGSCPCQSFSSAGKQLGFKDHRHLWPHMFRIVRELQPRICLGEQVASKAALAWWDLVASDLESENYAATAIDLTGASIGAPHIRSRLFWVGYSSQSQREGQRESKLYESEQLGATGSGESNLLAHSDSKQSKSGIPSSSRERNQSTERDDSTEGNGSIPTFWDDAEWLPCRDGKYRATKSGISPLAPRFTADVGCSGDPSVEDVENTQEARMMRLKGYGNAIVAPLAIEFVSAVMEIIKLN